MNPHVTISVPASGSVTCSSLTYTPVSSSSFIHITFVATWQIGGTAAGGYGQWYCKLMASGSEVGMLKHGIGDTVEHNDTSPISAKLQTHLHHLSRYPLKRRGTVRTIRRSILFRMEAVTKRPGFTSRKSNVKRKDNDAKAYAHRTLLSSSKQGRGRFR